MRDYEREMLKLHVEITHALSQRVASVLNYEVGIPIEEINILKKIKAIIKEEEDLDET